MANAPIIKYYLLDAGGNEGAEATLASFISASGSPSVKAGTESAVYKLRVYNDKANTGGVATATDVDITTIGSSSVVTDKWMRAKLVGDPTYTPETGIGGSVVKTLPNIVPGGNLDLDLKMTVPSNAAGTTYNFLIRVSYSYTG